MRVISGSLKGRKLQTLKSNSVRPTSDRVKEAVFSIIQFDLPGAKFLDLFSGSGQMGIEAISRGASESTFVDISRESIDVIRYNLSKVKINNGFDLVNCDSISFLKTTNKKFDIAYLDPPYKTDVILTALDLINTVMTKNSIVICESPSDKSLPDSIVGFQTKKNYQYGNVVIAVYRQNNVI